MITLNDEQASASQEMCNFAQSGTSGFYLLQGKGGVGKTTTIQTTISEITKINSDFKVCLTAPTNKATKVLREMASEHSLDVECKTLYSLLGLVLDSNDEIRYANKMGSGNFTDYDLIVVDEVSVVQRKLFEHLEDAIDEAQIPCILMGDKCQLSPVKENRSPVFDMGLEGTILNKIMRQAEGNPIIDLAQTIRDCQVDPRLYPTYSNSVNSETQQGVHVMGAEEWIGYVKENFASEEYESDPNSFRCLAYTNNRVGSLNRMIRSMLLGETESPFIVGEWALARRPIEDLASFDKIHTDTEARVIDIYPTMHPLYKDIDFKVWSITLQTEDLTMVEAFYLHSDSKKDYNTYLNTLGNKAKKDGREWKNFWAFKDSFADLQHIHAMTVHRCVHPNTLVISDQGMLPIKDLNETGYISTCNGVEPYKNLVANDTRESIKFGCDNGVNIEVTLDHDMKVFKEGEWVKSKADTIACGDWFRVRLGNDMDIPELVTIPNPCVTLGVRAREFHLPKKMGKDLAELVGIMVADGTIHKNRKLIRVLKSHKDLIQRASELLKDLFGYCAEVREDHYCNAYKIEVNSSQICEFFLAMGGMAPNAKNAPQTIMRSDLSIQVGFLRGLFEGGTVNLKSKAEGVTVDHIELSLDNETIIDYVHNTLFRLGIVSTKSKVKKGKFIQYVVYIYGRNCQLFSDSIGFITKFKKDRLNDNSIISTAKRDRIPVTPEFVIKQFKEGRLKPYEKQSGRENGFLTREAFNNMGLSEEQIEVDKWHYVRVKSIDRSSCKSMCVEVEGSGSFLQNGQDHGNSQGSTYGNAFVDMRNIYKNPKRLERLQLEYVAVSRARENLVILEK